MRAVVFALLLVLIGCEGPMGPAGPQGEPGPKGEQGIQGPAGNSSTRVVLTGSMLAATYAYDLPVEAGTMAKQPTLSCLVREPGMTLWAIINGTSTLGRCGFEPRTTDPNGPIRLVLHAPEGWQYSIIVGY